MSTPSEEYSDALGRFTKGSKSPTLDKVNLHLIILSQMAGLYTDEEASVFIHKIHELGKSDDTDTKTKFIALGTGNLVIGGAVEAGKAVAEVPIILIAGGIVGINTLADKLGKAKKDVGNTIRTAFTPSDWECFKPLKSVNESKDTDN